MQGVARRRRTVKIGVASNPLAGAAYHAFGTVANACQSSSVIRLALPPTAAVLTLMLRSRTSRSGR